MRRVFKAVRILGLTFFLLAGLPLLFLCVEHWRGAFLLGRYERALAAQGEPLRPSDLGVAPATGTNGAVPIAAASRQLVKGPVLPDHRPPRMQLTDSGRAAVGFRQQEWTDDKQTYNWPGLAEDVRANQEVLEEIRLLLDSPVLDNQLDYSQGPKLRFSHLISAKSLASWFGASCELALHENRLPDGLDNLIAEVQLPRLLERDRMVISELVRVALGAIARVDTWEALQAEGWTDAQLVRLEQAWQAQRFIANFSRSLQGERVFALISFEACRASNAEAASVLFWMDSLGGQDSAERPAWETWVSVLPAGDQIREFLKKQVYCRVWRFAWLDQCQLRYLQALQELIGISRTAEKTSSWVAEQAQNDQLMARYQNQGLYDALRFPWDLSSVGTLSHAISRAMRAETERSLVLAAIGLKRYRLQHSRPPESLGELVPRFLEAVPTDYMDGQPLRFFLQPDRTPVLYSVGEDGRDDHGSNLPGASGHGLGPWARRDVVWPEPVMP